MRLLPLINKGICFSAKFVKKHPMFPAQMVKIYILLVAICLYHVIY